MAGVSLETLTAKVDVSPYTGLTAIQRQQSGIARAQVTLRWDQTTLSSTTSGNIKGISFFGQLPRNFAYVYYGGSIEIGRLADTDVLDSFSRGCHFENVINAHIQQDQVKQDAWTMELNGSTKLEDDINARLSGGSLTAVHFNSGTTTIAAQYANAGTYDPYNDVYKKIYNDIDPPRTIYRAEEDEIDVRANVACMVLDPFPASQFLALGRMHFLQYDIDQAYNYLIHSPIPVR